MRGMNLNMWLLRMLKDTFFLVKLINMQIYADTIKGMDTISRKTTLVNILLISLPKKSRFPRGANSFLLESTPFQKGVWCVGN